MSDAPWTPPAPQPAPASPQRPYENVLLGLIFACGAVLAGALLTAVLWRVGFVASISSYAIAAGAVFLYLKGAGAPPRAGLIPLVLLIIAGIAFSFYAAYLSDLFRAYGDLNVAAAGISKWQFFTDNIWHQEFLTNNVANALMFIGFGALGAFRTISGLLASRRAG